MLTRYFNSRLITTLLLGFASGLPLALVSGTLQAWFTDAGIDITTIGLLGLVGQPYLYKFLWAPLMDRYIPPLAGRRRGWILLAQLGLILGLVAVAQFDPIKHDGMIAVLAFGLAFLSASQDIAIDAYRTELLLPEERGLGAAMGVAGYRIAMIVSGSLALIIAQYWGWRDTYLIMAACMLIGVIAAWFGPEVEASETPKVLAAAWTEPLKEFFGRPHAWAFVIFIILFKFGEAFTSSTGALINVFLLRHLHFSLVTVGTVNKGVGLVASLAGVFAGGVMMTRMRLYHALMLFGLLQAISNLAYMGLAMAGHQLSFFVMAVSIDNFCAGLGMAAVVALFMALCDHRYTATQFALFTALAAVPRVYAGPLAAEAIKYIGWVSFYFWTFVMALPGLYLLWWLQKSESTRIVHLGEEAKILTA